MFSRFLVTTAFVLSMTSAGVHADQPAFTVGDRVSVALDQAINTEIPGLVVAVVTQSHFNPDRDNPAISPGTAFIGHYESVTSADQSRLPICFFRVISSDSSLSANTKNGIGDCLAYATDKDGAAGLPALEVNRRAAVPIFSFKEGHQFQIQFIKDLPVNDLCINEPKMDNAVEKMLNAPVNLTPLKNVE
ncbi:TrbI/VirB10 family protein [Aestuariispira insulae]|uniref:Conjugative transfer protein TrbI n=1 Tax=Aestuariispira insulae TaxID=1461337 RepID=A0A3D9H3S8_9PROT|nr:TrbI/VirB10 family protein [Aestuariispira insulae]RED44140.1 conjugative transfer protein TrbI [Aestuariispira insulae]